MNLGTLEKMPQYKDKKDDAEYNLGLLLYPVLMAADIIINDPDIVIIGRDQVSHLDLCNDIAKRIGVTKYFNYEFGDVEKVMALNKPESKMSKSQGEKGVLYLFDEQYATKLKKANMNEYGLKNMQLIADNLGIDSSKIESNLELKTAVADKMLELFQSNT
jgi:tryptophanyl-tRNA synthetase